MNNELKLHNTIIDTVDEYFKKEYFLEIKQSEVLENKQNIELDKIRLYKINSMTFEKNSDILNKLSTVYTAIHNAGYSTLLLITSDNGYINFYLGVKNDDESALLPKGLKSQFGIKSIELKDKDIQNIIDNNIVDKKQIASYIGIPSLKNEDPTLFSQGLEVFVDAMRGHKFTALFISNHIDRTTLCGLKNYIENIHDNLSPLKSIRRTFGTNENESISNSFTESWSESQSDSISSKSKRAKVGGISSMLTGGAVAGAGAIASTLATGGMAIPVIIGGAMLGGTVANLLSDTATTSSTTQEGGQDSYSETYSKGTSTTYEINYSDKRVENLLKKLDKQSERISNAQSQGMFECGCFFLSDAQETVQLASTTFKALMTGKEIDSEDSYILNWGYNDKNSREKILEYLKNFQIPRLNSVTAKNFAIASLINSNEMALIFGLPRKSVNGMIVKESVEFGRNILETNNKNIELGSIIHLDENEQTKVQFPLQSLTMHTLITGSTGSGKSTTTYKLIDEIINKDVKFLVIEPTKGEYKHIFGNNKDIKVYGTNCKISPLLKINPFSFPYNEIHILEHIDRLVEIFNACWPMYAAMPAILKDAILKSYENCGWDLEDSISVENNKVPSFYDVLDNLDSLLESSMYSDNTKADYKGALTTRVKSLTQGLIKSIFTQDALSDVELFDNNVIIDISRIGSSETKSLIMGIMILKLNEYRISSNEMNKELKHITILEEAHHILPRVSTQASQDSGNIKGKAVEMLSNAIAEMRTYGQGFVIVDQSPNMLDISAIRNTNTKIIMRLSELDDRNDVGKAAALSEEQINEIPKLSQGVAIVYQNGWESAVLCKVDEIKKDYLKKYEYEPCNQKKKNINKIIKLLTLQDSDILIEEQLEIIKEFEQNEEMKKYLSINSLQERVTIVQEFLDARGIRASSKIHTYESVLKKIRKKIVDVNDEKYGKLLVNFILINLSHITKNIQLLEIENMLKTNEINDFITLHHRKNIERIEKGIKHV